MIPQQHDEAPAPFRHKLLFWMILGALSVVLAEGVSFSFPLPFFSLYGLLVVYPLYTLHALVLCSLIFGQKRASIPLLYLAGMLVGLYEAYMTKVLWLPTWGQEWTLIIGGVYMMHTMTLVVYWHPVMALMLPVLLAENLFTASGETRLALPSLVQRMVTTRLGAITALVALFAYFGVRQGLNSPHPLASLGAGLSSIGVLFLLGLLWRRVMRSRSYTFRDILPDRRQFRVLAVLLFLYYLGHLILFRPEELPREVVPHLTIWLMYALIVGLLVIHLRRAPPASAAGNDDIRPLPLTGALAVAALFPLLSAVVVALKLASPTFHHYLWLTIWLSEWAVGAVLFLWTLLRGLTPR